MCCVYGIIRSIQLAITTLARTLCVWCRISFFLHPIFGGPLRRPEGMRTRDSSSSILPLLMKLLSLLFLMLLLVLPAEEGDIEIQIPFCKSNSGLVCVCSVVNSASELLTLGPLPRAHCPVWGLFTCLNIPQKPSPTREMPPWPTMDGAA